MAVKRTALLLPLLLALAGCAVAPERLAFDDASASCEPREKALGSAATAYAVSLRGGRLSAYARPGGRQTHVFAPTNVNGVRTVLGILGVVRGADCEPSWYRVQLPVRPNGATGYVRAADTVLHRLDTRIEVDLSERRVQLFRAGRLVLATPAAIGSSATPTPVGRFYVNQRLVAPDPAGPFGPGGIGISAFSPVLTGWAQGGPIAIHGTNDPSSIGKAISNGCIRVENDALLRLFDEAVEGTPVVIRA